MLIGEPQNVRLVAHQRSAVLVNAKTTVRRDVVPERVRQRVALVQHAARVNQLLQRVAADLMRVVVLVPLPQIFDCRVQTARADLVEVLQVRNAIAALAVATRSSSPGLFMT